MYQNQGQALLNAWMEEHGHNQTSLAEVVRIRQSALSTVLRGGYVSLERAVAIYKLTGVPVESWLEPYRARRMAKSA